MSVVIGLPSKGRLRETAMERFAEAGIVVESLGDERAYRGQVSGEPGVEVRFLSSGEIARELASGVVDLGVTGEDLVRENIPGWDKQVKIEARLGFGHADVVVAVPDVWYDVRTMADLEDVAADFRSRHGRRLRIATKYWRLTQEFFSRTHAIQVYRIVESLGATEGAPASGQADIIVDITTTGSTLAANHLRVLSDGVILKSEACLVSAIKQRDSLDADLLKRIAGAFAG